MYCPRCGSKCEEYERFCKSCGEPLKREGNTNNYDSPLYNYNSNITDEMLEEAYVGPNYQKIKSGRFSFSAFFFGIYYLIYRKMWLYALGWFAIIIAANIFIVDYVSVVGFGLIIASGIGFNKIYMQHAKKKIEKLKDKYSNHSKEELLKICKNKGGTSVGALIVIVLIIFAILTIAVIIIFATEFSKEFNFSNSWKTNIEDNYKLEELTYEPPQDYKLGEYATESYKTYKTNKGGSYCSFSITSHSTYSYKTEEEYLKKSIYASIGDNVSEVQTIPINNRDWKLITVENENKISYYYAILFKDKIYNVEYSVYIEGDHCKEDYEQFMTTLKLIDGELVTS